MRKTKTESFVLGAAILTAASIIVKIIGAFYKIPLGMLLGPVGMADFSVAYNIYALLFVISTAGVPSAVSKLVSENEAKGNTGDMLRTYRVAYVMFALIGIAGFSAMFFFSEEISVAMGNPAAGLAVRAVSPAVLLVTLSAINRGYFQGRSDMVPTAVSEVVEAFGKLIAGLGCAWYFKKSGFEENVVAAGAVMGVSIGALLSFLWLSLCGDKKGEKRNCAKIGMYETAKKLILIAVPITAGAAVMSLANVIDGAMCLNLLQKAGMTEYRSKWLFGAYTYATCIFNLPTGIITTLSVSLIPALSALSAKCEAVKLDRVANSGILAAMLVAFPATAGIAAMSREIMNLLYGASVGYECAEVSSRLLQILSLAIIPLSIVTVTNAIHQSLGNPMIPLRSMAMGSAFKLMSNFMLVGRQKINIYGAALSTVLCYLIIAVMNVTSLRKYSYLEINIFKNFIKPMVISMVTYISVRLCLKIGSDIFAPSFLTIIAVFVGLSVYAVTVLMTGAVDEDIKNGFLTKK